MKGIRNRRSRAQRRRRETKRNLRKERVIEAGRTSMATKRWLRSENEEEYKTRGGWEDKQKRKLEDGIRKEVLTVQEDSEDNIELFNSDREDRKRKGK